MKKTKRIVRALLPALALCIALAFTGCGTVSGTGGDNKFAALDSAESVYGFSAASAGMLISEMTETPVTEEPGAETPAETPVTEEPGVETPAEEPVTEEPGTETPAEEPGAETPDKYLALADRLLGDGAFRTEEKASDRPEYRYMLQVGYTDMTSDISYVLYYNETPIPDDDDDDDEDEAEYFIEGVMTVDGAEYPVRGTRSSETDGRETESETEFRVTLAEDRYMLVEQGYENDDGETEQTYSYSVYEGGRLIERSTFEYETERGETELKLTSRKDGKTSVFVFDRETVRGEEVLRLTVRDGQTVKRYLVRPAADGGYEYTEIEAR